MILDEPMNWWVSLLVILPMVAVAIVMNRMPPTEINTIYGYRTSRSMSSQKMWDEANRFFEKVFIIYILVLLVLSILFTFLSWFLFIYLILYISGLLVLIPITERHLINFEKKLNNN